MTAEQQLERSVLEGKERDELHAIALALSVKTTTRTKKADMIDGILKATGVAVGDGDVPGSGSNGTVPSGVISNGSPVGGSGTGTGGNGITAATRTRRGAGRTSTRSSGPGDDLKAPEPVGTEGDTSDSTNEEGLAAAGSAGSASSATSLPDSESRHHQDSPAGLGGQNSQAGRQNNQNNQNNQGNRQNNQGNRQNNQGNRQNSQGQGNQNNPGNRQGGGNQGGSDDLGNRRNNRRRRGRDRPGDGGERDLQGAGNNQDQQYQGELIPVRGLLDLRDEGYGFLRCDGYLPSAKDAYVSISQARRFALRKGDYLEGACRPAGSTEKYPALLRIDTVSSLDPEAARNRPRFEDLTPLFPDERLNLELPGEKENMTTRIVDLLSPIGKGQRGLIVSPPKAGKTTVMKHIAHSIEANNADVHLMVLLVDERPEEVTDMRRSVKGEVVASTFDRPSDEHTAVAELAIERAKRLVEVGRDVVIILDGITRLARAYNLAQPATGRIMSGGVDSGALYPPKRFFGAARNIEEGGSLTILATALVETGSKMDEVIFEEFKGTGNMELRLDRRLAERRLYPAIDVNASSTRHEELLFDRSQLQQVWKLRRVLNALANDGSAAAGLELLMDKIRTTASNDEFLAEIAKGPAAPT
ncbi:MAG: transcription termination factor Rho [Acidimicrobiales bacterium]